MFYKIYFPLILFTLSLILPKYINPLLPKPKIIYGKFKIFGIWLLNVTVNYVGWLTLIIIFSYNLNNQDGKFWIYLIFLMLCIINLILVGFNQYYKNKLSKV